VGRGDEDLAALEGADLRVVLLAKPDLIDDRLARAHRVGAADLIHPVGAERFELDRNTGAKAAGGILVRPRCPRPPKEHHRGPQQWHRAPCRQLSTLIGFEGNHLLFLPIYGSDTVHQTHSLFSSPSALLSRGFVGTAPVNEATPPARRAGVLAAGST